MMQTHHDEGLIDVASPPDGVPELIAVTARLNPEVSDFLAWQSFSAMRRKAIRGVNRPTRLSPNVAHRVSRLGGLVCRLPLVFGARPRGSLPSPGRAHVSRGGFAISRFRIRLRRRLRLVQRKGGGRRAPREDRGRSSELLLIRLFQQTTMGSVERCRDRPSPRASGSFKRISPATKPARTTWPRVGGRTGSLALGAGMGGRTLWSAGVGGNALPADTRSP
jgi:hypothetical protein